MRYLKIFFLSVILPSLPVYAQEEEENVPPLELGKNLHYRVEAQGSFSDGRTPLWLNANKYGLSSLERENGYMRGSLVRPLSTDSARRWGVGYGFDAALASHYTSKLILQQAYVEGRWLHGTLTVGSKEYPMELKNNELSSGSQTLGINARPVPQVRLSLPDYWVIPGLNGWLRLKGHLAYGRMTDDGWQHDVVGIESRYADDVLFHSKAGYLKIGNEDVFCPLTLELGLEMAATFGGKPTIIHQDGTKEVTPVSSGIKSYWHAFIPGGADNGEGVYANVEGNQLGSWVFRLNYEADTWRLGLYGDHYFEDHSQMFLLDYNGYGTGDEWNEKKDFQFYVYDLKDMMLGIELNFKYRNWLKDVVFEYLYTKYQSGPYNHDRTRNIPDHIAGEDNYYNHGYYTGWQHWGQVIGNPLYRSPLYNENGVIDVQNNRFMAFHLGLSGQPASWLRYRGLVTWLEGFGTYHDPYTKKHHNVSFMVEAECLLPHHWQLKGAYGMDFGHVLGNNAGFQLTVSKSGIFSL